MDEHASQAGDVSLSRNQIMHCHNTNHFIGICCNSFSHSDLCKICRLTVLGFNDTSALVGHFVLSPREKEKKEEIVEVMKERDREERGTGIKVKKFPPPTLPATKIAGLAQL